MIAITDLDLLMLELGWINLSAGVPWIMHILIQFTYVTASLYCSLLHTILEPIHISTDRKKELHYFVPAVKPPADASFLCKNISFLSISQLHSKPCGGVWSQVYCEGGWPSVPCMNSLCSMPQVDGKQIQNTGYQSGFDLWYGRN